MHVFVFCFLFFSELKVANRNFLFHFQPILYNATGGYSDQGRFMGRRMDQGKRRPLHEVADKLEHDLTANNCSSPSAQGTPGCVLPIGNFTGVLNVTANWTMPAPSPTTSPDDAEENLSPHPDGSDASDSGDQALEAGEDCAEGDTECLSKSKSTNMIPTCDPDDKECLAALAKSLCPEDDEVCMKAVSSGDTNTTESLMSKHKQKHHGFFASLGDMVNENGPMVALGAVVFLAAFIALGAVFTNVLKEKRKQMKLQQSLKDALLKQQDEIWTKSGN
jgi:hypothetical protein